MKLIKTEDEQGVMYSLSGDNLPENYVLSKENCDEIFGVVDVEKLAKIHHKLAYCDAYNPDIEPYVIRDYTSGFEQAISLNKDKVFNLEDMRTMYSMSCGLIGLGELEDQEENNKRFEKLIQPLLQPTEINVEIEMEDFIGIGDKYTPELQPKLDSSGCLILKRK